MNCVSGGSMRVDCRHSGVIHHSLLRAHMSMRPCASCPMHTSRKLVGPSCAVRPSTTEPLESAESYTLALGCTPVKTAGPAPPSAMTALPENTSGSAMQLVFAGCGPDWLLAVPVSSICAVPGVVNVATPCFKMTAANGVRLLKRWPIE
eukprot:CAMPEP_0119115340 /NCGR_PEP_ID=MMETSP1180-20130426/50634_1 /TAXON_ID=3052 ORGANISM="Chlamydomonas cf sp, Strain CCMP681" /NCGR_SAMPLE_ID=MMETSP1180 /ASSEMBLY_ACC=CAM_ASM_000741 /LENGTH=148 /DNA_ID=CAMNT_0007104265 /DNA_START=427 /DNA_END=873 /DNA_ORIENTATION=-